MAGWMRFTSMAVVLMLMNLTNAAEELLVDNANFDEVVANSQDTFVIEYYSKMCGSCKEFEPAWHEITAGLQTTSMKHSGVRTARCSIDTKDGMKLAKDQGVLNKGIPAVQIIQGKANKTTNLKSELVMAGKILPTASLKSTIHSKIGSLLMLSSAGADL
eukprot:FR736743.1.p1 GENE.FR736743.1~~FR736743.1.p1  ORF type:complete len:178 (+),score=24.45 FR736743.1:55-534(+)